MKFLLSIILATLLSVPSPTIDFNQVKRSVTMIHNDQYSCSAFSPSIKKLITAAHCIKGDVGSEDQITMDGVGTRVRYLDKKGDIAVLDTEEVRPPLELGEKPKIGDQAFYTSYGASGNGTYFYIFQTTVMSIEGMTPIHNWKNMMSFSTNSIVGMSGGPIIDRFGKVISSVIGGADMDSVLYMVGTGTAYDVMKKAYSK